MYPALFTSLLFLGFLGFHFIYKGIISQKLILIVAFINVLLWLPAISTNTFKWLLLKNKLTYLLILLRITLIIWLVSFDFLLILLIDAWLKNLIFHEAL
jgi:hypothetical protein